MNRKGLWLICALVICFFMCRDANAGLYVNTISPGNVPWPNNGTVPYVFDPALSAAQQQTYLNALREYELAANVHFVARTSETQYILFKYNPSAFDSVSGSNPQVVEVNSLTRAQICHEMGHSFGLLHEHTRSDRGIYVTVLSGNITAGNQHWFDIDPNGTAQGAYDFESVMHFSRNLFSVDPTNLDTLQAKTGFERFQPRMSGFALSKGDRAVMKYLYGPGPTLSSVVTNTSESGLGGLRAALHFATDNPGTTITFNIPTTDSGYANGVFTIHLTGHLLPLVTDGTIIDGTTQPGYAGSPLIVLDGSQILPEAQPAPGTVPGMHVFASNCTVKGFSIQRFPWVGLALLYPDAHNNAIRGCWFGLDYSGAASAPNQFQGIQITNGANSNTIGGTAPTDRNVLSGNNQYGIWIGDANTTGNVVLGNYIGTKADGSAAVANGLGGIIVTNSSHDNTIGGTLSGARNVISGNIDAGVWITGTGVNGNTVRGNYIGLHANGSVAVPNTFVGLYVRDGAQNNLIADNVISGNVSEGLRITDVGTSGNRVEGNQVGTAPGGGSAIANGFAGATVYAGATDNTIGGTTAAQRNILSGNGTVGLAFSDASTSNNKAEGNYIGTNASGTASVPNGFAGVYLTAGASANYLGDAQPGTGNLISGNAGYGVFVADPGTNGNFILGNFIGTNVTGTTALANASAGIIISNGAQTNMIGGSALGASNIISGNTNEGIVLFNSGTVQNWISQNSIFANGAKGIVLNTSANNSQAYPILSSATLSTATNPNGTDIAGTLNSAANTTYRLEFFASPTGDPSGFGEGRYFIGSTNVVTNGAGSIAFTAPLTAMIPAGNVITATATDATNPPNGNTGNTSEFSATRTVVATVDANGDGLPDNYQAAHPGVTGANADTDGDGQTNLQEFKAGTDPKDPKSRFMISSIDESTGDPRMSFQALAGKTYRLEYRDDLNIGNWNTLVDGIFSSTTTPPQSPLQIVDPGATGLGKRFYRLSVEP